MIGLLSLEGGKMDSLKEVLRDVHHDWTLQQKCNRRDNFKENRHYFQQNLSPIVCNMKGTWQGQESICQPVSLKSYLLPFTHLLAG